MSTFKVEVRKIEKIYPHTNADKLELGKVDGLDFQFVMQKDTYQIGDLVVYFPVDSMMTEELKTHFDLAYLAGPNKNRVKTVKLRKEISQGLVLPFRKFGELLPSTVSEYDDVTEVLKIVKYEVPEIECTDCNLHELPDGVTIYDIEGYERFPDSLAVLMDMDVVITEKLEGTNFSVTDSDKIYVNSRRKSVIEIPEKTNYYWLVARRCKVIELAARIKADMGAKIVTVRAELCGPSIQGNIYKLKEMLPYIFDIQVDGKYLDHDVVISLIPEFPSAPVLERGKLSEILNGKSIADYSDGKSVLNTSVKREGIVIKPLIETETHELGRLILKKRSPDYLANSDL